ncbi:MAG: twin-arginine translocase TatA/TatE family subunit [Cytophagales bacterium]|nr:twin-arginine translocase TatA/TatE family subunit [Cytophagales bacterium]
METLNILCFSMPGGMEWIIIIVAVLLLFGAKKIPELARGLGRGIREFKDGVKGVAQDVKEEETKKDKK